MMQSVVNMILDAGKTGVELSLYIILPVMVVMMAIMKLLEDRGVLQKIANLSAPLLSKVGLPGMGVFAILQMLFVSFAAPVSTLKLMERDSQISDAKIGATMAAILVMAQANATFPLAVVGLNIPVGMATSVICGCIASLAAYKMIGKDDDYIVGTGKQEQVVAAKEEKIKGKTGIIAVLFKGGEEGMMIAAKSMPPLILAVFLVNMMRSMGLISWMEIWAGPLLEMIGIPGVAVLPIVTKFIAGGTAMMAIVIELVNEGAMTVEELNRIAGFTLNPLDPVGVAIFLAAGERVARVARPAMIAAILGILIRGVMHIVIF